MKFMPNFCVCGCEDALVVFSTQDYNFNTTDYICDIKRCVNCDSIFPDVFPDSISIDKAYSTYYTRELSSSSMPWKRRVVRYLQGELAIRALPENAKNVLDFGCGSGDFLIEVSSQRPATSLFGTDISSPPKGFQDYFQFLEYGDLHGDDQKYDWVTLSHVIEHVRDPIETISSLTKVLAVDGSIWISTPNANCFLFKEFGQYARDVDFPRHRLVFSDKLIKELFERLGYRVTFMPPPLINTALCFFQCMRNLLRDTSLPFRTRLWRAACAITKCFKVFILRRKINSSLRSEIVLVATK